MRSLPTEWQTAEPSVAKQRCRAHVRQLRRDLSAESRSLMDDTICMHTVSLPCFLASDTILGFYPIGEEPNILPILQTALSLGKRVALPRCHPETSEMSFHVVSSLEQTEKGYFGLREPSATLPVATALSNAFCLVPALAFDRRGHRIGYGKGYYDRFLADYPGFCVGIGYGPLLFDVLPCEPTDRAVSMIITERGILLPDASVG